MAITDSMLKVIEVLDTVDPIARHLDQARRSRPSDHKRPRVDSDGDVDILNNTDCDRPCCVSEPHSALVIPEVLTAILEPLEDDPVTLRLAICVSRQWARVALNVYLRCWITSSNSLMRMPPFRQPFFAAPLRSLSVHVVCARGGSSAGDLVSSSSSATNSINKNTAATRIGEKFTTFPRTICCPLHAPWLVFRQLRQLDLSLDLGPLPAAHGELLDAFLARCGLHLARAHIRAMKQFSAGGWAAVLRQLALRQRLDRVSLQQQPTYYSFAAMSSAATELSGGLELAQARTSRGGSDIHNQSNSAASNCCSRSTKPADLFQHLRDLEIYPLLPSAVSRLRQLMNGCQLHRLALTVLVPWADNRSSNDNVGAVTSALTALATLRCLRQLRLRFRGGHVKLASGALLALQALTELRLLSLAPATDVPVEEGGDELSLVNDREGWWAVADLFRALQRHLKVLELRVYDGDITFSPLEFFGGLCPALEELVLHGSPMLPLGTTLGLPEKGVVLLPRLRRLRFVSPWFGADPYRMRQYNARLMRAACQHVLPHLSSVEIVDRRAEYFLRLTDMNGPGNDYEALLPDENIDDEELWGPWMFEER